MAKVLGPIDDATIRRFKGKLDFYGLRGQTYVRSWPQSSTREQTNAELIAQCLLMDANAAYQCTPQWMRDQYAQLTSHMWFTRRDFFMKFYFGTIQPATAHAWDNHPPQPGDCSGSDGHYWHLVHTNAYTFTLLNYRLEFWFDQPLRYTIHLTAEQPPYFTVMAPRTRRRCEMARVGPVLGYPTIGYVLGSGAPNLYRWGLQAPFIKDYPVQVWGYITASHPVTGHPSLSLTPWFSFVIPPRRYPWNRTSVPGLIFTEDAYPLNPPENNPPRPSLPRYNLQACLNATIH